MAFQLPTTTTAAAAAPFSFGLTTAAPTAAGAGVAAAPAKPATFSFAATPSLTGGGGDADTLKAAQPPQFGFGLTATSTPAPSLGLGGFGAPAAATASTPAAAAAPAATPLFGGFKAPAAAATTSLPAAAPAAATSALPTLGLGLTTTPAAKSTVSVAPGTQQPPAAAVAPLGATIAPLGAAQPSLGAAVAPLGAASTAAAPLAGTAGSAFANLSTATKTTDSATVANASQLSYHQLEEHINKWTLEFEEQEKVFTEQATQINAWDKLLISNNQKILELNDAVQKVKTDQQVLDQELEFIATQHKELEESLIPLEKEFDSLPRVDIERSQTYLMVENLDTQLKQMSEDLKEIIDNLNEANKGQDNTDPIIQIGKILNAHMSSLSWIESQSTIICKKLDDIGKIQETQKRDIFRAAF